MLELKNIVKDYVSGNNTTHALKGISVNFRKNEFVSILGASGCGKTTTLNIIGGLDRYTSGDLLINGKSTKEYKDRDWDTYRNHSIGFVFQTYNLISHQSILKNVELALTISGVSKEERKERAYKALETVGLKGMEKKKPNQLSGGQCQRVAIARALINNPEILLADEPTGALDSETSVQIMELLKEVASNRLVIMVTHNPDLAYKYSSRIIKMSDGLLVDDSNPFDGKEKVKKVEKAEVVSKGRKKKTSMSLLTAIGLSTSNLLSKIKRTILVTIAGSIGIIGVSAVLGVSRGVTDYINILQNDMLSSYPISIAEESLDYSSLMTGLDTSDAKKALEFDANTQIGVDSMINYLMNTYTDLTNMKTNKIDDTLMSYVEQIDKNDAAVITKDYVIDPTNNIFGKWDDSRGNEPYISFNGLTQRYIKELQTVKGFEAYSSFVDLFTAFMHELPDNTEYLSDQYDLVYGNKISNGPNDLVLVVDDDTTLTDLLFAQMGIFPHDNFINIALCAMDEQKLKKEEGYDKWSDEYKKERINEIRRNHEYARQFEISDLVGRSFYYFPENTIYQGDASSKVAADEKSFDIALPLLEDGTNAFKRIISLSYQQFFGFNLLYGSTFYEEGSEYKTDQIACVNLLGLNKEVKNTEDLYGDWYAFKPEDLASLANIDMKNPASIATALSKTLFKFSLGGTDAKCKFFADPSSYDGVEFTNPSITCKNNPVTGFKYSAVADSSWVSNPHGENRNGEELKITSILRIKKGKNFGTLSRGLYYSKAFGDRYRSQANESKVTSELKEYIKNSGDIGTFSKAYVTFDYLDYSVNTTTGDLKNDGYAHSINGGMSSAMRSLFSGMTTTNYFDENATLLRSLSGLKAIAVRDDDGNLTGAEFNLYPKEIKIYPSSFEAKDRITKHLDKWNSEVELTINGTPVPKSARKSLSYTDTIQIIVNLINTLIKGITIALVAFTSLSLVVSCFMIAVITYISVVERIKEIGVIRSLGGRKRDVANLFVTETMMTGLFSGIFGIAMTYLIQVIGNAALINIIHFKLSHLTIWTSLIMIGVSVLLSVLSGLIPSQSAAHKDPVVALRSNE